MTTGKIKWFNPTKGYGFIEQEGSKDVFLHVSALEEAGISTLKEGENIEFEIGENKGKENAINIKKVYDEGTGNRTTEDSL
jgi:CspA family cold shock protein|tara:strand:+ start:59 stop:301 length:243 start_codon:yes stop_codon:yes gene_type:complete